MVTVPANESELAVSKQRTLSDEPSQRVLPRNRNIMAGLLFVGCALEATKVEVETAYIRLVVPVWASELLADITASLRGHQEHRTRLSGGRSPPATWSRFGHHSSGSCYFFTIPTSSILTP